MKEWPGGEGGWSLNHQFNRSSYSETAPSPVQAVRQHSPPPPRFPHHPFPPGIVVLT